MSEKLTFNKFRRDGSAVHLYIRHCRAIALLMKITGHQFLSRTIGSDDEDSRICRSHLIYHFLDMKDCRRLSDHWLSVHLLLQDSCLLYQRHLFCRILYGYEYPVKVKRLRDIIKCTFFNAFHCSVDVSMT